MVFLFSSYTLFSFQFLSRWSFLRPPSHLHGNTSPESRTRNFSEKTSLTWRTHPLPLTSFLLNRHMYQASSSLIKSMRQWLFSLVGSAKLILSLYGLRWKPLIVHHFLPLTSPSMWISDCWVYSCCVMGLMFCIWIGPIHSWLSCRVIV